MIAPRNTKKSFNQIYQNHTFDNLDIFFIELEVYHFQNYFIITKSLDSRLKTIDQRLRQSIYYEVRDRPFNLKWGVMVFCFVQNFFFGQHES